MADIRQLAVDDVDSVIRAFYRQVQGHDVPLLQNLTADEKKRFAEKEREMRQAPEKRALDEIVDAQIETEQTVKKAKVSAIEG